MGIVNRKETIPSDRVLVRVGCQIVSLAIKQILDMWYFELRKGGYNVWITSHASEQLEGHQTWIKIPIELLRR